MALKDNDIRSACVRAGYLMYLRGIAGRLFRDQLSPDEVERWSFDAPSRQSFHVETAIRRNVQQEIEWVEDWEETNPGQGVP